MPVFAASRTIAYNGSICGIVGGMASSLIMGRYRTTTKKRRRNCDAFIQKNYFFSSSFLIVEASFGRLKINGTIAEFPLCFSPVSSPGPLSRKSSSAIWNPSVIRQRIFSRSDSLSEHNKQYPCSLLRPTRPRS